MAWLSRPRALLPTMAPLPRLYVVQVEAPLGDRPSANLHIRQVEAKKDLSNGIYLNHASLIVPFSLPESPSRVVFALRHLPCFGFDRPPEAIGLITYHSSGMTLTETWSSTNMLSTKVEMDNTLAKGLKAEVVNFFNPSKGATAFKGNLYFRQPMFHTRAFMDYAPGGNITTVVDGVVGHEGFLVGGEVGYDVQKAAVTRYSAAVGYTTPLMSAALTATNNMSIYSASYYQKVNSAVEAGAKASYDTKSSSTIGMEIASKYKIDPLSFAKVGSNSSCKT